MSDHQKIKLKGRGHHLFSKDEKADAELFPGMAVELLASGNYGQPVSTQAELIKRDTIYIVEEDSLSGKTVLDSWAEDSVISLYIPEEGDECLVLLKDGEVITVGEKVMIEGGGSGLFVAAAGTEAAYHFEAREALSPSGENGLLWVRRV